MKLVIKPKSFKALVALFIYKAMLDYAYLALITDIFGYMGMYKDVNFIKITVSYALLVGLWFLTPTGNYKIYDIFVNIQLLLMLIPMLTIYGATDGSTQYLLVVLGCHAVQCLFCMMYKERVYVKVNTANLGFNNFSLVLAVGVVVLCIFKYGMPSLTALNITRVYEIRSEYVLSFPFNYLVSWCAKILIPFGFILSLEEKKYVKAGVYLLLQLFLYLSFAHKTYLFLIGLAGMVWIVCKRRWLYQALYAVFPIGVFGSILIYKIVGNILAISYFARRVLIVPAFLKFTYFEYYSVHPKAYFYNSIIGKVFGLESSYDKSIAAQIGAYKGSPETMMNTGYLGEGYAQGGYFVLIIMSLLLIVICKACTLKKNVNMNVFLSMFILWIYTLNDVAMQTSLLTGGGLILILIFAAWPERKNIYDSNGMPISIKRG